MQKITKKSQSISLSPVRMQHITSIPQDIPEPIPFGTGAIGIARRGASGSILLTALSRPKVKNAFSDNMYSDLTSMLKLAATDDTISAIVLTGTGPYFSSGADLKNMQLLPDDDGNRKPTLEKPAGQFMLAMMRFPKIIAAAVNGPTVGIGVTLLLHCDLCYSVKEATFWAPFTRLAIGEL